MTLQVTADGTGGPGPETDEETVDWFAGLERDSRLGAARRQTSMETTLQQKGSEDGDRLSAREAWSCRA